MASEAQIEANRLNAQKSSGPKSAAGKQAVARNAITHGFYCQHLILPGEDEAALQALRGAFYARLQPQDELEEMYAERAVMAAWRLRRFVAFEQYCRLVENADSTHRAPNSLNLKHVAACERAMDKAIRELHQLRKIHPCESPSENRESKPNSEPQSGPPASAGASTHESEAQSASMRVEIVKTNPISIDAVRNCDALNPQSRDPRDVSIDPTPEIQVARDAEQTTGG